MGRRKISGPRRDAVDIKLLAAYHSRVKASQAIYIYMYSTAIMRGLWCMQLVRVSDYMTLYRIQTVLDTIPAWS